jgi:hypothetical protein
MIILAVSLCTSVFAASPLLQTYVQLPQTGQTTCFFTGLNTGGYFIGGTEACNLHPGQDGATLKGSVWPTPRFTDNNNGTIDDNLTGLTWLKKTDCFTTVDNQTWAAALTSANSLKSGSCGLTDNSVAGDWRVPNINELRSLIDIEHFGPALPIDVPGAPDASPFTGYYYRSTIWSSTSYNDPRFAWTLDIQSGSQSTSNKTSTGKIWLVKGNSINVLATGQTLCYDNAGIVPCPGTGQDGERQNGAAWDANRFVADAAEGTVTDTVTGLVWLKNPTCVASKKFEDGLAWSNNLASGTCSLNDGSTAGQWRLPNRNELMSLINYSETGTCSTCTTNVTWLKSIGFSGIQDNITDARYLTSDTEFSSANTTSAWSVDMQYGTNGSIAKSLSGYMLPVRDGNFLSVNFVGPGSGTINTKKKPISSASITCPGTCQAHYAPGSTIELTPTSNWYSEFLGWIGCDSLAGSVCSVTINQSRVATAVFDEILTARVYDILDYSNISTSRIQTAYDALVLYQVQNGAIITPVQDYFENLLFTSPINVSLTGGWNSVWGLPLVYAGFTTVNGSLKISNGKLMASNLKIK